ncbi:MAG TPA: hypothetical protein VM688_05265 [Nocardioidaceae bacterium]|nr:hypothetical protein [Nocardioidaceae bacterium]
MLVHLIRLVGLSGKQFSDVPTTNGQRSDRTGDNSTEAARR